MASLKHWLFWLLFASIVGYSESSLGCRTMHAKLCIANQNLTNHVLTTHQVQGRDICSIKCYMEKRCISYNLGPVIGNKRTCVLSDSDHVANPENIQTGSTYEYCSFKNPCSSSNMSCPNGTTCLPDETFLMQECFCSTISKDRCHVDQNCTATLGMENGLIPNASITASSYYDTGYEPYRARLNLKGFNDKSKYSINSGSWSTALPLKPGEYLQIDLGKPTWVTKVATQGRPTWDQWVTSYSIAYSMDGVNYHMYKDRQTNDAKVFRGNSDRHTVVTHPIQPYAIKAQYIRYIVKTWKLYISMRAELYGCPV